MNTNGLADAFRDCRQSLGLSQEKLAREMDVTLRTVARWEAGEPPLDGLVSLAGIARKLGHPKLAAQLKAAVIAETESAFRVA